MRGLERDTNRETLRSSLIVERRTAAADYASHDRHKVQFYREKLIINNNRISFPPLLSMSLTIVSILILSNENPIPMLTVNLNVLFSHVSEEQLEYPPTLDFLVEKGEFGISETGELVISPGSNLYLYCLFERHVGNPSWSWTAEREYGRVWVLKDNEWR